MTEAAARQGMSAASLLERLTPDYGLDANGQVAIYTNAGCWVIRLNDQDGAIAEGPVGADLPPQVSEMLSEIKATVSGVRARLETRTGRNVRTPHGTVPAPPGCLVQLAHPVHLPAGELAGLRQVCEDLQITQPVRQLWRETYALTAEERTGLYSTRYAGHILRFAQAYGLARRRAWTGGFLSGAWDGGDTANARHDYAAVGLRASWAIAQLDGTGHDVAVDLCLTERMWFSPLADTEMAPVPLASVPAEVFSEAMRDLIVSVTTVANDPLWLEHYRGWPAIDRYWEHIVRGGLDQLRVHRRAILAAFCDGQQTRLRYQLTDCELIVTGSLATYRIDLATANVRMEPAAKWLSFDTRATADKARNHEILGLPATDDDEILQRILIRAAILADDEQLASPKLLKQIRG